MFWICMYTLVWTWHTYALKIKSFWYFSCVSCFKEFWAKLTIFMIMCFTYILYTHLTYCFLMIMFSWVCMGFMDFECLVTMWFTCFSWNIILFYSLKDFVLVFKIFHITSCGILRYGRVFKHTIFSNLFLKTPTFHRRLDGRPFLVCFILKIILNLSMIGW